MRNIQRHIAAIVLAALFTLPCAAQQLSVKKVILRTGDTSAYDKPCRDNNDNLCALVIVDAGDLTGLEFPNKNQYVKQENIAGKYHVYIPDGMSKLSYGHESYTRGDIDFKEWGQRKLKGGLTYEVTIEAPQLSALQSKVVFKIEPADASLNVDDSPCATDAYGNYEASFADGTYNYEITKENYDVQRGSFTVSGAETKTITAKLKPQLKSVALSCNVAYARVYVDDVYYGEPGELMLPRGTHKLRVEANKYMPDEKEIDINSDFRSLYIELFENSNKVDVHAVPITINSHAKRLYVNNRKVKEWTSGKPIQLMPDEKYRITDSNNHKRMIKVKRDTPMEINL